MRKHIADKAERLGLKSSDFLDPADLVAFINRQSVSNMTLDPTLHFLLQDCSGSHQPLNFKFGDIGNWPNHATVTIVFDPALFEDTFTGRVEISWAAACRDVTDAVVAIANYQQAVSFAAKVTCFLGNKILLDAEEPSV